MSLFQELYQANVRKCVEKAAERYRDRPDLAQWLQDLTGASIPHRCYNDPRAVGKHTADASLADIDGIRFTNRIAPPRCDVCGEELFVSQGLALMLSRAVLRRRSYMVSCFTGSGIEMLERGVCRIAHFLLRPSRSRLRSIRRPRCRPGLAPGRQFEPDFPASRRKHLPPRPRGPCLYRLFWVHRFAER